MSTFVQLPMTTTTQDLEDIAIAYLQTQWIGWVPNDGDMDVIMAEALAPLALNAAEQASQMPLSAFIAFGTKLLGIPYDLGSAAQGNVTFTVGDTNGYTIPAGSQIEIDGYGFELVADAVVAPGSTTVDAQVFATVNSATQNDLVGLSVSPISTPPWVVSMSLDAPTSGGADPQTDQSYADQLSRDRTLISRALVTLVDYETIALDQPGIARAHADYGATARDIVLTVLGSDGLVVSPVIKNQLLALITDPAMRMTNASPSIADPTLTTINVVYSVIQDPNFDPVALISDCNAAISLELSPLGWGVPGSGNTGDNTTTWVNESVVHYNRVVAVLGNVQGVNSVPYGSAGLTLNGGTGDVAMSGTVCLPQIGTLAGSVAGVAS